MLSISDLQREWSKVEMVLTLPNYPFFVLIQEREWECRDETWLFEVTYLVLGFPEF